ncbi:hypothetical protein ACNKHR_02090 [Shigella flexneri]
MATVEALFRTWLTGHAVRYGSAAEICWQSVPYSSAGREADTSNYALIPTAEVPLTNLVRGEIINEDNLPIKMTTRAHASF